MKIGAGADFARLLIVQQSGTDLLAAFDPKGFEPKD